MARLACTKPGANPAVTPVNAPRRISARISFGWRASIGMVVSSLREMAELRPAVGIGEHVRLLAAQHAEHLLGHLDGHPPHGLAGHPGDMRRHDDLVQL